MTNFGIKILKPTAGAGVTVLNAQPKDLIIISTAECHKQQSKGYTTSSSISNPLGYICYFETFGDNGDGSCSPKRASLTTSVLTLRYPYSNYYSFYYEGNG